MEMQREQNEAVCTKMGAQDYSQKISRCMKLLLYLETGWGLVNAKDGI